MVPGMVVTLVFALLVGWNDVLFASVLTTPETQTVAIQLQCSPPPPRPGRCRCTGS